MAAEEVEVHKRGRRRLLSVGVALCLHGLLLLALGSRIPHTGAQTPVEAEAPPVQLSVVRLPRPETPLIVAGTAQQPKAAQNTAEPSPDLAPHVLTQPAPGGQTAQAVPDAGQLQNALRGLVGCGAPAAYGLTAEQKAACVRHYAEPAPVYAQIDPKAQAAFDADAQTAPLLVRTPKNGCLPRVADRKSATETSGRSASMAATTTAGVGCAWSF